MASKWMTGGLALALVAGAFAAQDQDRGDSGRWFERAMVALDGGAPPPAAEAAPAGEEQEPLDPDALVNIADKTASISLDLEDLDTGDGVVGDQIEVEADLDALIAMLEKRGG